MPAQSALTSEVALREAAQFVLETMFFAESEPIPPQDLLPDARLLVEISFDGDKRGRLSIGLPESCARTMAASFEGIPDAQAVGDASVAYVVLELANMICGATLTRLHGDGFFRLGSPEFNLHRAEGTFAAPCQCWLGIPFMDDAVLHLVLKLEDQP